MIPIPYQAASRPQLLLPLFYSRVPAGFPSPADDYLEGVSRVLGEAHTSFANEVKRTLDKANIEFHTRLAQAVGLLSSEIDELGLTLASMGAMTPGGK